MIHLSSLSWSIMVEISSDNGKISSDTDKDQSEEYPF